MIPQRVRQFWYWLRGWKAVEESDYAVDGDRVILTTMRGYRRKDGVFVVTSLERRELVSETDKLLHDPRIARRLHDRLYPRPGTN